jgi:hypothetical protein
MIIKLNRQGLSPDFLAVPRIILRIPALSLSGQISLIYFGAARLITENPFLRTGCRTLSIGALFGESRNEIRRVAQKGSAGFPSSGAHQAD